ncbi:hypothetical protein [Micromonospora sp. NPDC050276]|uniref:hypothetical protein n=1 Tax=Micromonospora sp. NPDC050276 TaxID=3364278 RepID=UPI0037A1E835
MLTYVRWYWPDEGRWNYDELGADRRALRHVELRGSDGVFMAAASLAEVLIARDSGAQEFERLWRDARRQLEQQTTADSSVREEQ